MTISSEVRKAGPYDGNDVTTSFPFSFKVFSADDVVVVLTDPAGIETALTGGGTDYSVTLNADQDAAPGGTVEKVSALATDYLLTITSSVPNLQPLDLTNGGGFYPKVINAALDRLTILIQQLSEKVSRAVKNAISAPAGINPTLPAPVPYQLIGWNSSGTGFQNTDPTYSTALATDLANSSIGKGASLVALLAPDGSSKSVADLASATTGKGSALIGFLQDGAGAGAVARTVQDKLREAISVKDFGAKGDGSTDDTSAIQAAINYLNSIGGGRLYLPSGTYLSGKLTVYSNIWLVGEGRSITTIKLKSGANTDLIYGAGSDSLWGSGSGGGISGFGLFELTLDGNRSGNTSAGSCVAVYGEEIYFQNLFVTQARDYGIRTEWADADSTFGMEAHYINVRIDGCGKDGWYNNGPHDAVSINVIVIDASLNTDKTYDGIRVGPRMTGRFIGCHVWNRAASNRHRYGLNIEAGGGGNEFIGCHFEGAWGANVGIFCSKNIFDDSCRFYSAWNGVNIYMGLTATLNTIKGHLDAPGADRPACVGIYFGSVPGDYIADNYIDVKCINQEAGNFTFTAYDNGNNKIRAHCFNTTAATINGVPNTNDDLDIWIDGYGSGTRINNKIQRSSVSIGANASATWNFPYAFPSYPYVTFSPQSPSGSITSGIWISSISSTYVTFYNNNAVSMTINAHAHEA